MSYKARQIKVDVIVNGQQALTTFDNIDKKITSVTYKANNSLKNAFKSIDSDIGKIATRLTGVNSKLEELRKKKVSLVDPKEIKTVNEQINKLEKEEKKLHTEFKNNMKVRNDLQKIINQQLEEEKRKQEELNNKIKAGNSNKKEGLGLEQQQTGEKGKQISKEEELKRIEKERLQNQKQMINNVKTFASNLSSIGQTMMGMGIGTATGIMGVAQKYTGTFSDMSKTLGLKHDEMGASTIDEWNNYAMLLSKRTGMSSNEVANLISGMANTTNLHNTLTSAPVWGELAYVTGTNGDTAGQLGAIYSNISKLNGWENEQQFADYIAMGLNYGGGTGEQFIKALNNIEVVAQPWNKNHKASGLTTLTMLTAVDPTVPHSAAGLRQSIMDFNKKDMPLAIDAISAGLGMTNAQYVESKIGDVLSWSGTSLKGLGLEKGIHSQKDLEKMPLEALMILGGRMVYEDFRNVEDSVSVKMKNGKTKTISAKELFGDLLTTMSGTQKGMSTMGMAYNAYQTGKAKEVITNMNDENATGAVQRSRDKLSESTFDKLSMSLNSISTNFMILSARFAPFMAGFLEKMVKWTDKFEEINWEEGFAWGEKLFDIVKELVIIGGGLFIFSKVARLATDVSTAFELVGRATKWAGGITEQITKGNVKLFSGFSKTMVDSGGEVAKGAAVTAKGAASAGQSMIWLGAKVTALTVAIGYAIKCIYDFVSDWAEFGKSAEYLQGREDAYNKKDTVAADVYNKMNSTAFGKLYDNMANGNYLSAIGDLSAILGVNGLGAGTSAMLAYASALQGQENLNALEQFLVNGYNGYEMMASWAEGKDIGILDWVLSGLSPDYKVYNKNQDKIEDVYNEYQGNYVEKDLANAESYFNKTEDQNYEDAYQDLLSKINVDDFGNITNSVLPSELDEDAIYDAISGGAEAGTEKGVKNALQGHFNTPDTYSILGQVGLGQLNQYEGFAMKKQGNQTVINNNNVSINIEGNEEKIMATLEKVFGNTGALSGTSSYSIA